MKKASLILMVLGLCGCAMDEGRVRQALEKEPRLIFDVIEKNPEQFIEVVNKAARQSQRNRYEKQMTQMREDQEKDLKSPRKPIVAEDRVLVGDGNSPVTIVEYGDFQCPACRVAFENLQEFKKNREGKVRFVFKHMPLDFHPMAMPSALYFEALRRQGKKPALRFHDLLFEKQSELKDEAFLKKMAKDAGADMKVLEKDLKSPDLKKLIQADMAEFEAFGFTGTPVVIVNGVALQGAQPVEELERIANKTTVPE